MTGRRIFAGIAAVAALAAAIWYAWSFDPAPRRSTPDPVEISSATRLPLDDAPGATPDQQSPVAQAPDTETATIEAKSEETSPTVSDTAQPPPMATDIDATVEDEPAVDETAVDETAVDEPAVDETSTDQTATDETTANETSMDEPAMVDSVADQDLLTADVGSQTPSAPEGPSPVAQEEAAVQLEAGLPPERAEPNASRIIAQRPEAAAADPGAQADPLSADRPDVNQPGPPATASEPADAPVAAPDAEQRDVARRAPDPVPERAERPNVIETATAPTATGLPVDDNPALPSSTGTRSIVPAPRMALAPPPRPGSVDRDLAARISADIDAVKTLPPPRAAVPVAPDASEPVAVSRSDEPEAPDRTVFTLPILSVAPEADAAPEAVAAPEPTETTLTEPVFDLVRVDAQGFTVVAGRADPGVDVDIAFDGQVRATVRTNASGDFVAMLQAELKNEPQAVTLVARDEGPSSVVSAEPVIVLAVPDETSSEGPALPAVIRATGERVEVVQPAHPGITDQVVLDTISYDAVGAVVLSGRGTPLATVRIYANDRPIGTVTVADSGAWQAILPDIAQGRYTLRVDELDNSGARVASRMETPFQRDDPLLAPEAVRAAIEAEAVPGSTVVVQPGNNLWTIARQRLGRGIRYTYIFTANRDRIRDPDLIYPGQIFDIPDRARIDAGED